MLDRLTDLNGVQATCSNGNGAGPTPTPPTPTPTPAPEPTSWAETTGGVAHTWTNPANAGGSEGPQIPKNATVAVSCRLNGFRVADGNTW
jgi:hypothetical protein